MQFLSICLRIRVCRIKTTMKHKKKECSKNLWHLRSFFSQIVFGIALFASSLFIDRAACRRKKVNIVRTRKKEKHGPMLRLTGYGTPPQLHIITWNCRSIFFLSLLVFVFDTPSPAPSHLRARFFFTIFLLLY